MLNYDPEAVVQHNENSKPVEVQPAAHTEVKKDKDPVKKDLEEVKNILEFLIAKL